MSDLAENLSEQSAANVLERTPEHGKLPPKIIEEPEPVLSSPLIGAQRDYHQATARASANFSLINMAENTPSYNRTLKEAQDRHNVAGYAAAFSGLERAYVTANMDNIMKRLYPNEPSLDKWHDNFKAIVANSQMALDRAAWGDQLLNGDSSSYVLEQIASRERNMLNYDNYTKLMPHGSIRRGLESGAYYIAEQFPQMRQNIIDGAEGASKGVALAMAAAAVTYLTGGAGAPAGAALLQSSAASLGGAALGGSSTGALLAYGATGAKVGATTEVFTSLQKQLRGAAYLDMIDRMREEGLEMSNANIAQMSQVLGAVGAAINTVELGIYAKHFGANKMLSKAYYQISSSPGFMATVKNAFGQRLRGLGGVVLEENIGEIVEEIVDYVGQELFFKMSGSETAFDITGDEIAATLGHIAKSTTVNSLAYGVGLGTAGAMVDASVSHMNNRANNKAQLSAASLEAIQSLPDMQDVGIEIEDQKVILENVDEAKVQIYGDAVADVVTMDPTIEEYLSPAQKDILAIYRARNPSSVRLKEALSFITGMSESELAGLSDFDLMLDAQAEAVFDTRIEALGIEDGIVSELPVEGAQDTQVVVSRTKTSATIEYDSGNRSGVIVANIDRAGKLSIQKTTGDKELAAAVIEGLAPGTSLFSKNVKVPKEFEALYSKLEEFVIKPSDTRSQAEVLDILDQIREYESRVADMEAEQAPINYQEDGIALDEDIMAPVTVYEEETYYEEVEVEEEVPVEETIKQPLNIEPVQEEETTTESPVIVRMAEKIKMVKEAIRKEQDPAAKEKMVGIRRNLIIAAEAQSRMIQEGATVSEEDVEFFDDTRATVKELDARYAEMMADIATAPEAVYETLEGRTYRPFVFDRRLLEGDLFANKEEMMGEARKVIRRQLKGKGEIMGVVLDMVEQVNDIIPEERETREARRDEDTAISDAYLEINALQRNIRQAIEDTLGLRGKDGRPTYQRKKVVNRKAVAKAERARIDLHREYRQVGAEINKRLNERIAENDASLYELGSIRHDLTKYYDAINLVGNRLAALTGTEQSASIKVDTYSSAVLEMNNAFLAMYENIFKDIKRLWEEYAKEPTSTDKKPGDRVAEIVDNHRDQLNTAAKKYFGTEKITPGSLARLKADRAALYEYTQKLQRYGDVSLTPVISSENMGAGEVNPASIIAENQQVEPVDTVTPDVATEKKKVTKRVKKTRQVPKTVMQAVAKKSAIPPEMTDGIAKMEEEVARAKSIANSTNNHIDSIVQTIIALGSNVKSPKAVEAIGKIADKYEIEFYDTDDFFAGDTQGLTPDEMARIVDGTAKRIASLPMSELHSLYEKVLATAKTDARLTSFTVGDTQIPYHQMMQQIIGEVKDAEQLRNPDFLKGFERKKEALGQYLSGIYHSTLDYDLLIDKISGKHSLTSKVLYHDIKAASNMMRRFNHIFEQKYHSLFTTIPGIEDPSQYYQEVVLETEGFQMDRHFLLTLLQHKRVDYNWKKIMQYGISVSGVRNAKVLTPKAQKDVTRFVENYKPTYADLHVLDTFQSSMNELYELANERHKELYGKPLPRNEFYIRLRPDNSFDTNYKPQYAKSVEDVQLVFDTANIYERKESKKPIRIMRLADEFTATTNGLTNFYYMEKSFTRAQSVINTNQFKEAVQSRYGKQMLQSIQSGLSRWAGERVNPEVFDHFLDKMRQTRARAVLTLNPEVALRQVMSFPMFNTYVDAEYLTDGFVKSVTQKEEWEKILNAWSTLYLTRGETSGNLEIYDTMNRNGKSVIRGSKNFEKIQYYMMRKADKGTIRAGMVGAMLQVRGEIERGYFSTQVKQLLDIDDSIIPRLTPETTYRLGVQFAEKVVERTQPTNTPETTSHFQRATAVTRSIAAFSAFTNKMNTLLYREGLDMVRGVPGGARRFAMAAVLAGLVLPTMAGLFDVARQQFWKGMRGEGWLEEEPNDYFALFGGAFVKNLSGYWFVIKDVVAAIQQFIQRGGGASSGFEFAAFETAQIAALSGYQFMVALDPRNSDERRENAAINGTTNAIKAIAYTSGVSLYPFKYAFAALEREKE